MVGTWLGEIRSCSSLAVLPDSAWVLLNKIYKPFLTSLYMTARHVRLLIGLSASSLRRFVGEGDKRHLITSLVPRKHFKAAFRVSLAYPIRNRLGMNVLVKSWFSHNIGSKGSVKRPRAAIAAARRAKRRGTRNPYPHIMGWGKRYK